MSLFCYCSEPAPRRQCSYVLPNYDNALILGRVPILGPSDKIYKIAKFGQELTFVNDLRFDEFYYRKYSAIEAPEHTVYENQFPYRLDVLRELITKVWIACDTMAKYQPLCVYASFWVAVCDYFMARRTIPADLPNRQQKIDHYIESQIQFREYHLRDMSRWFGQRWTKIAYTTHLTGVSDRFIQNEEVKAECRSVMPQLSRDEHVSVFHAQPMEAAGCKEVKRQRDASTMTENEAPKPKRSRGFPVKQAAALLCELRTRV